MRAAAIFGIGLRQQVRDPVGLGLTTLTAPFFVLAYWLFFGDATQEHRVVVWNQDVPEVAAAGRSGVRHADALLALLDAQETTATDRALVLVRVADRVELEHELRQGKGALGMVIPSGFSRGLASAEGTPPTVTLVGDATSLPYQMARAFIAQTLNAYVAEITATPPRVTLVPETVGLADSRSAFDLFVPGLLVFAVIMIVFSSAMSVAREVELGTLVRIRLTPARALDVLAGMSAVQLLLGLVSFGLTLLTARLVGFRSQGPLVAALLIGGVACLSSVGLGMVVGSLSPTTHRAFLISGAVMYLLILFSGVIYPNPGLTLFEVGGREVGLFDFLPTTEMRIALGKVLNLGASLTDLRYELGMLSAVSVSTFALGVFLFQRSNPLRTKAGAKQ